MEIMEPPVHAVCRHLSAGMDLLRDLVSDRQKRSSLRSCDLNRGKGDSEWLDFRNIDGAPFRLRP
jgi:hypothetical protein